MRNYINYFLGFLSVASFFSGIAYVRLHYHFYFLGVAKNGLGYSNYDKYLISENHLLYSVVLFIISISIGIYLWKNNFFTRNK